MASWMQIIRYALFQIYRLRTAGCGMAIPARAAGHLGHGRFTGHWEPANGHQALRS
jgi:hypothetical protein